MNKPRAHSVNRQPAPDAVRVQLPLAITATTAYLAGVQQTLMLAAFSMVKVCHLVADGRCSRQRLVRRYHGMHSDIGRLDMGRLPPLMLCGGVGIALMGIVARYPRPLTRAGRGHDSYSRSREAKV